MGKDYAFVVNGQTGQKFGELPVSPNKKLLFGLGIFAATFLLVLLLLGGAMICG